jgi:hypothetical protein
MTEQTYRRGQVEWALWRFSTLDLPSGDEPASTFRARVEHLLQLDRSGAMFKMWRPPPPSSFALSSHQIDGKGVDATFTAFDAFCLALGVDFMRTGFKQSEVLLLVAHLRPRLVKPFADVLRDPPKYQSHHGRRSAADGDLSERDRRVFLIIERVEFAEAFPDFPATAGTQAAAIYREPMFCHGIDDLRDSLSGMDHLYRRALVFEIAHMAARIAEFLERAPQMRRGRPSNHVSAA